MNLCVFESCNDFIVSNLNSLVYLSLSKNKLINLIGVGEIKSVILSYFSVNRTKYKPKLYCGSRASK